LNGQPVSFDVRHAWRAHSQVFLDELAMVIRQFIGHKINQ
jgi:hypothetical protein